MGAATRSEWLSDAAGRLADHTDAARSALKRFLGREDGTTAIEYAVIASLISIMIFAGAQSIGRNIWTFAQSLAGYL
ncbi:MAG: Flp family type IVb pilin [Proteobacteria bacterium]|nr:Flp family type IVb pilin [Pseudomonadota bacterium]